MGVGYWEVPKHIYIYLQVTIIPSCITHAHRVYMNQLITIVVKVAMSFVGHPTVHVQLKL